MGDVYASETDRLNDMIRQYRDAPLESFGEMAEEKAEGLQSQINKKVAEYTEKYKTMKDLGDEELGGVMGLEVVKKGYKEAKSLYQKYKKKKAGQDEGKDNDDQVNDPDGVRQDGTPSADDPNSTPSQRPNQPAGEEGGAPEPDEPPSDLDLLTNDEAKGLFEEPDSGGGASASVGGGEADADLANQISAFQSRIQAPLRDVRTSQVDPITGASQETSTLDRIQQSNPFNFGGDPEGEQTLLGAGEREFGTFARQAGAQGEGFLSRAGSAIRGFVGRQSAKNVAEGVGGEVGDVIATTTAATGEAAGLSVAGALSAIPVVGEVGLAVAGLVSLGEGIYHLFHHPKTKKIIAQAPGGVALPQASDTLTNKYAMALPDIDTSQDRMASVGSF